MTQDIARLALIGKVVHYLENTPGGDDILSAFISGHPPILTTEQVMELTGWKRNHIIRLCKSDLLPYIPGHPHRFILGPFLKALHELQIGGPYGRQKTRKRSRM